MEPLKYLLLLSAAYSGLAAGCIISHYTQEELNLGRRYFRIGKISVFVLLLLLFLLHLDIEFIYSAILAIFAAIPAALLEWKLPGNDAFFYAFFAIVLFEVTGGKAAVSSTLVFLYGIFSSSFLSWEMRGIGFWIRLKTAILYNTTYFFTAGILLLFFST